MTAATTQRLRPRVTRREAAKILQCSYDNVRRLERTGKLLSGKTDRNGTVTHVRREVEELARRRGSRRSGRSNRSASRRGRTQT
jgi:hypothetical protein